ncbi:hypothetical protein R5R35_003013 [Gryllus longicercus]|uniref:Uncharacterized protein n=1 Tax=Gryllus longicercus TaxID=2509291 RepID=A0AAN9V9L1_9ORTH
MDSTVLSVSWKDHSGALTEVCKTLLDNNFLVDCTIAAEGKALKAHRLILSACSPYFQMLFGEDCEKHPIVIIQNASFETLKAMVDFMYHGETQVPEERLEAFLTLAETLQIKGLNDSSKKNRRKLQPVDSTRETRHSLPSEDQKVTCEVQIASASHEPSPENSSEQHHSYHSEEYTDVTENCSVSLEGNNSSYEPVKSTSVIQSSQQMPPLLEQESRDAEHNVKSEPMHHVYLVPKHEQMDEDEGDEPPQDVSECDINEEATSGFDEQHMNQYSSVPSCSDSGNVLPGAFAMPQMAGPPDVQAQYASASAAPVQAPWGVGPPGRPGRPAGSGARAWQRRRAHACPHCPKWFPSPSQLLVHTRCHTGERPFRCGECGAAFSQSGHLTAHARTHTGERPFKCDVCGDAFAESNNLTRHRRTHTGERPYGCDACPRRFVTSCQLRTHQRRWHAPPAPPAPPAPNDQ